MPKRCYPYGDISRYLYSVYKCGVGYGLKGVKMAIETYLKQKKRRKKTRPRRRPALKKEHLTGTVGLITHLSTKDLGQKLVQQSTNNSNEF